MGAGGAMQRVGQAGWLMWNHAHSFGHVGCTCGFGHVGLVMSMGNPWVTACSPRPLPAVNPYPWQGYGFIVGFRMGCDGFDRSQTRQGFIGGFGKPTIRVRELSLHGPPTSPTLLYTL
jgi:hypothetical protein